MNTNAPLSYLRKQRGFNTANRLRFTRYGYFRELLRPMPDSCVLSVKLEFLTYSR